MSRLSFILLTVALLTNPLYGQQQTTIFQDSQGRILTTLKAGPGPATYSQITLLGSPFLTYPVWQEGKFRLGDHEFAGKLSYNLMSGEVFCQLPSDSTTKVILPDAFTINNTEFTRQLGKLSGVSYHRYFTILYSGRTKLLMNLSKEIRSTVAFGHGSIALTELNNGYNSYGKDSDIKGIYKTTTSYYIQKGEDIPQSISLTKKSLLRVLHEQANELSVVLPSKNLSTVDVEKALAYYDHLMSQGNSDEYK